MSKSYIRGERRYQTNRKRKDRICDIIRTWGGLDQWNNIPSEYPCLDYIHDNVKRAAKTRHPYSGDTRRVKEEYRQDYRSYNRPVRGDEGWD